jgi:esterase/lipase
MLKDYRAELAAWPGEHDAFLVPESRRGYGGPYWLQGEQRVSLGVVLIHGFLSCPEELRPLAKRLQQQGIETLGARLSGHGTSPLALAQSRAEDWLNSVRQAYHALTKRCARVALLGFSTGGLLALRLASERPAGLGGVVAVCAPAAFTDRSMELVPWLHSGLRLWQSFSGQAVPVFRVSHPEYPRINYRNMPLSALASLHRLVEETPEQLLTVNTPVSLFQSSQDPVVSPESMTLLAQNLPPATQPHWIKSPHHNIIRRDPGAVVDTICETLKRWR